MKDICLSNNDVDVSRNKRIAYFDLMKGICITLVVIEHCTDLYNVSYNRTLWSMLEHLRMPLYFFLSGMFFKEYSCFGDFVVRKLNKIVIPYIFFIVIDVGFMVLRHEVSVEPVSLMKSLYGALLYGTIHLWFLRTLFVANIFYYVFNKYVASKRGVLKSVLILSVIVTVAYIVRILIGDYAGIRNLCNIIVGALMVMPFFYVANVIKMHLNHIYIYIYIYMSRGWRVLLCAFAFMVIALYTSNGEVSLNQGKIDNNLLLFYIAALSAIMSVFSFCYLVKRLWYFSYVGRYSLIVYAIHFGLILSLMYYFPEMSIYECCFIVLVAMPPVIWLFKTLFPAFVAQRDMLLWENGRVKVDCKAFSIKKI